MRGKKPTVINQLFRYYKAKERDDGEWFLPEIPTSGNVKNNLAHLAIADQLQRLVTQLRLPGGEWIKVTPETLPNAHLLCVLFMAKGKKLFALGKLNSEKEWLFSDYSGRPEPLFYLPLPIMTKEMHKKWEMVMEDQAKDEEL